MFILFYFVNPSLLSSHLVSITCIYDALIEDVQSSDIVFALVNVFELHQIVSMCALDVKSSGVLL